eukprot:2146606-Amphidinium_carterae.1
MPVIEPTKELAPMDAQKELTYWRVMWNSSSHGITIHSHEGTPGDEFFDRKCRRLGGHRKQDQNLPMGAYLLPKYPLNEFDKSLRLGQKYDPTIQLTTRNLIGTLALDPKREVAWMIMRRTISSTPSAWEVAAREGTTMDADYVSTRISDFQLQTKHNRAETEYIHITDVLRPVFNDEPCTLEILCHRVTSA